MFSSRHNLSGSLVAALLVCLVPTLAGAGSSADGRKGLGELLSMPSPDGLPRRLVLAVDGLPFDLFAEVQQRGHFAGFHPARRMVSTFPSLTDVAFSTICGSGPPEGYQVMRFDREQNRIVGNSVGSLSSEAHRHVPADTQTRSAANRVLGYVHPLRTAMKQLRELQEDLLASRKETFVGYIEATDYLLHIHGREATSQFLIRLDSAVQELDAEVRRRTGRGLAVDIVSDHGSTHTVGRTLRLGKLLRECGFQPSKRLSKDNDVAYTRAGIINSLAISSDPAQAEAVARCLAKSPGVDIAAFNRAGAVVVLSSSGEAEIRLLADERYSYRVIDGDPLELAGILALDSGSAEHLLDEDTVFRDTLTSPRPDPIRRLWRAFNGGVLEPSEVLVSLEDGYESSNRFVHTLAALRGRKGTHGSLTSAASLGILTSNWRAVWDQDTGTAHEWLFGSGTFEAMDNVGSSTLVAPTKREEQRPGDPAAGGSQEIDRRRGQPEES